MKRWALLFTAGLALAAAGWIMGRGGTTSQSAGPGHLLYSVKFLCGLQTTSSTIFSPPQEPPVKPGNYATAINIHNFSDKDVKLQKKAVIALPEREPRGPISAFATDVLRPDEAMEVDCTDIAGLFGGLTLPGFIKGFVEINSPVELSVIAVYSAQTCHPDAAKTCATLGELDFELEQYRPFIGAPPPPPPPPPTRTPTPTSTRCPNVIC